jgi:23S rRNA (cytidine1920-2'-O)/16S rRNA (cytidine1409-2'-O)-methyltransferase
MKMGRVMPAIDSTPWPLMHPDEPTYASRAGLKLHTALQAFGIDPTGLSCADLGCSTGGFTDCLLQHGAKHVYAVDTAYGELAWKLRQDERVTVLERSNALHLQPAARCGLITIDLGWTPQRLAIPAADRWLTEDPAGRIITLIKPHYEASADAMGRGRRGKLDDEKAREVTEKTLQDLQAIGFRTISHILSPIRGGKGGNIEYLALLARES